MFHTANGFIVLHYFFKLCHFWSGTNYEEGPDNSLDLYIDVEDTGIGLTSEACKNIFNPFTQADASVSKAYGGTGLGLTIAKDIAEKMSGGITVESTPDAGSTFHVILRQKISRSTLDTVTTGAVDVDSLRGKRFLIIDDCPEIGDLLVPWFEALDIHCEFASDLLSAGLIYRNALANKSCFDGVLLDWPMEGNDVEESRQILIRQGIEDIPLFIMIPFGRSAGLESHYDGVIAKPLIHDEVFSTLADHYQTDGKDIELPEPGLPASADLIHAGQRILVVEDNESNQLLVEYLLEDYGIEYDLAENGKLALEKIENTDYDLILMDVQMPIMDGLTATSRIREALDKDAMPIVALTANTTPNDLIRCKNVGMNDVIPKPREPKSNRITWILRIYFPAEAAQTGYYSL